MLTREQKKRKFTANEILWKASAVVAVVAALLALVTSILLVANYVQINAISPIDNPELLALRKQLAASPQPDDKLVAEIRALDLLARKAFFTSQAHLKMGGRILIGSTIVLLAALRALAGFKPKPPIEPGRPPVPSFWIGQTRARQLVAFAACVWIMLALVAAHFTKLYVPLHEKSAQVEEKDRAEASPAATAYPDWEAMQLQWPTFRGPGAIGIAHYTNAPTEWDVASGKNMKWKTEVPLPGANSPVVWSKRMFLTGADENTREIFCFDTETGQLVWRRPLEKLPGTPDKPPKVGEETGYAASSMAAHGDRVFAIFANGDLACFDVDGNMKWGKNIGVPENHYGYSSSLLAFQNLVFVQYDQNKNGKLMAFDIGDGHEVWNAPRKKISWASPACVKTAFGFELILNSEQDVDAYDPITGAQAWTLKCLDGEVAPSPAYGGGMFFVANDNAMATAIKFDSNEKTPNPSIAWQWDELLPDVASPVGTATHFYITTSRGQIACLDAQTGKQAWIQEFDEGFSSSPVLVGDRIYAFDQKGIAHIFKTGPAFESISTPSAGEPVLATPAYMDGRIYIRTEKNLICVGS